MMGIFCAEWLKTKGGALRPLVFLLSPLVGAVLAWYVAGRPWIAAGSAFSGFFSVWAALVMPLALAIVAGQLVHEEEDAANFNGLLLCAKPRALLYLVKLALLLLLAAVATGLAVGAFVLGLWLGGYASGGAMLYAEAGAVCWLAAIPLAALSLWLAFAFGMGVSIGVGMGGMLIAAILGGTLLGDAIWPFVPWAWPVRLASAVVIGQSREINAALVEAFMAQADLACALALVGGMLLIVGGGAWFSRWDGRDTGE